MGQPWADQFDLKDFLEEADLEQYYALFRDILKVTKVSQLKFVDGEDLTQIGLSKPEQRQYKKIYAKYFPNVCVMKLRKILRPYKRNQSLPRAYPKSTDLPPCNRSSVKVPTKHIIPIDDITINNELGTGEFGIVQQGTWTTGNERVQVAIKYLGQERMASDSGEFLKEAAVMHNIEHPNIVRLYGVVLRMDSLMLVTELAPYRSLLECLREVTLRSEFPLSTLCYFAEQICDGMTYLENKRLIHRDLAARNILVFSKDRVKISDFGLSRALGVGKDYYQTNYNINLKLPIAWCAPECILYLKFTSATDVWAYGVCLWEMFSYGCQPWAGLSGHQILGAIDVPNIQRLERPLYCPIAYYNVMLKCWEHDPHARPKFKELGPKLRHIHPQQVQALLSYSNVDGRRHNILEYTAGDIITVVGKESLTNTDLWYGILRNGTSGFFDPVNTKTYEEPKVPKAAARTCKPQNLEQIPLINSNSLSHTTGGVLSTSPYPLLHDGARSTHARGAGAIPKNCGTVGSGKGGKVKSTTVPTTNKSLLERVKSATLGTSFKADTESWPPTSIAEEHEYQEISDKYDIYLTGNPTEEMDSMFQGLNIAGRKNNYLLAKDQPQHDSVPRAQTLGKIEKKKCFHTSTMKPMSAHDQKTLDTAVALANELTARSMTDLEVHDHKQPNLASDRHKFHFKLPLGLGSLGHSHEPQKYASTKHGRKNFSEQAKGVPDIQATLTEESKLAYISLIEEPAFSSHMSEDLGAGDFFQRGSLQNKYLRPQRVTTPTTQYSNSECTSKCITTHKWTNEDCGFEQTNVLPLPPRSAKTRLVDKPRHTRKHPLVIPSTNCQVPIVNKQSVLSHNACEQSKIKSQKSPKIYQNLNMDQYFREFRMIDQPSCSKTIHYQNIATVTSADVLDGPSARERLSTENKYKIDKDVNSCSNNPFSNVCHTLAKLPNPFTTTEQTVSALNTERNTSRKGSSSNLQELDHVSVEDLLEFADLKPCGRQRGIESDEVRIMSKVLKQEVTPESCLEALELTDWDVHRAIKMMMSPPSTSN